MQERKNLAPRARFELATLRLTVAASDLTIECDDLLWCWFSLLVQAILLPCQATIVCYGFWSRVGTKWGTGDRRPAQLTCCRLACAV
jgi:hypothetical protein